MGIQINGQTDIISATDGSLTIQGASGNITGNVTGDVTGNLTGNVTGNVNATGISTFSGGLLVGTGASVSSPATNVLTLGTNNSERVRISSNGNLGIGTINPTTEFEVLGAGTVASFRGTGGSSFIGIKDEDDGTLGFIGVDSGSIKLQTSGSSYADKLVVDSSGRIIIPYQPAFQTVGTNYSQSSAAYSIIIPNVVVHNQGSHYNGSTGRFTAPIAGRYLFGFWGLSYPHNTEVNQIRAFVNGNSSGQEVQFGGAGHLHINHSGNILLNLSANDIFDFRYLQSSGSAKAYNSQWNMWGYLIG